MNKLKLFICVLFALPVLIVPSIAHADVNDFTVSIFSADYYLTHDDNQGSLLVKEKIDVDFTADNHGILRALPERYNGDSVHLKINQVERDGLTEKYTTYHDNGNTVLKIGNATRTVTGHQRYEIAYSVDNVIDFTSSQPVLRWNVNGTGWQQPFSTIIARLHLPADMPANVLAPACYTGAQGSTASDCIAETDGQVVTFQATRALLAGENLTLSITPPAGYFAAAKATDKLRDIAPLIAQVAILPVVAFIAAFALWYRKGRDLPGRQTIVPEYTPPEGLSVLEADYVYNYGLSRKAVSAAIIGLAIKKYLKIVEIETKQFLSKTKSYQFIKMPAPAGGQLSNQEALVLAGLFENADESDLTGLSKTFYKTVQTVEKSTMASVISKGFFSGNPRNLGSWLTIGAIIVGIVLVTIFRTHWAFLIGLVLSVIIVILFANQMPRREASGVAVKDALDGLKLYMNTAEKDRIAMLQSPNAPYAAATESGPEKTVQLFEKLLPFAIILGVENEWAKQFMSIYTTPPDWYAGNNWNAFNAGYLASSLTSATSAMSQGFAAPSSSGAGSGGGFSGGGGGGGGGGGW